MTSGGPKHGGGLNPWVANTPEPVLSITGHTAVISPVRYVWPGTYCSWCRQRVELWTDGGTIEAGIRSRRISRRSLATTASWFRIYRPASAPSIPDACPHPGCPRPATRTLSTGEQVPTGWLDGRWNLAVGPFTVEHPLDPRCPHPVPWAKISPLLDQMWSTLRRTHPDVAAAADAYAAEQRRRAERG